MADKELLQLAAKAAGLRLEWQRDILRASDDGCVWEIWNPLTSDGDALRLMVKLGLTVYAPQRTATGVWVCVVNGHGFADLDIWEKVVDGPMVATRRAIVRAAAELGATHD